MMSSQSTDLSNWTVIVGAGISKDSGCPLFKDFWSAFLSIVLDGSEIAHTQTWLANLLSSKGSSLDIPSGNFNLIDVLPPEQLFYRLQRLGNRERRVLISTLLDTLTGHLPNANHEALALMLAAGAQVWTTNYDTLIEDACDPNHCHVIAWHPQSKPVCQEPGCRKPHLMKLHGTLQGSDPDAQHLIFDAPTVIGLEPEWTTALAQALQGQHVLIAGYRGHDADVMPIISSEATNGRLVSGVWYEGDVENRNKLRAYLLDSFKIPDCANPSIALQQHCASLLRTSLPVHIPVSPRPIQIHGFPVSHLAATAILDLLVPSELVRQELLASIRSDPFAYRGVAAARLLRSIIYDNRSARIALQAVVLPLARNTDAVWENYLLSHETHVSTQVANRIMARIRDGRAAHWSFPVRASAASILKLTGPLHPIPQLLPLSDLHEQGPSHRGKGSFNLLWASRFIGDIATWEQLWKSEEALTLLFDPNWAAWMRIEEADFWCIVGDGHKALAALEKPEIRFEIEFRHHATLLAEYTVTHSRAHIIAHESPASPAWALSLLKQIEKNSTLCTPFRYASLVISAASLLSQNDSTYGRTLLKKAGQKTPSRLHRVLIHALSHRFGKRASESLRLLEECRELGFGYGEALLLREFNFPDSEAQLFGARQVLSRWSQAAMTPTVWIVP